MDKLLELMEKVCYTYSMVKSRLSKEYLKFKKDILERDNYCCQKCGKGKFNMIKYPDLHVHHIKSWEDYPELRVSQENCIVLCRHCHILADKDRNEYYDIHKYSMKTLQGVYFNDGNNIT